MQKKEETASKRLLSPENFHRACRICFTDGNLYNTKTSMYEDHTIDEILESLINVDELNIQENFAHIVYPQFICLGCINQLIYTKLFLDQCYKAHKTLSKVYTYLTLYQHKSVLISKPFYLYKTATAKISQRSKLNKNYPKLTLELKRAILRKREEKMANKTEEPLELENDTRPTKRMFSSAEINRANKRRKIVATSKHDNVLPSVSNKFDLTSLKVMTAKEELAAIMHKTKTCKDVVKVKKILICKDGKKPRIKDGVKISPSPKSNKTIMPRKRLGKYRKTSQKDDDLDYENVGLIPNTSGDDTKKKYNENVERIKNGCEPIPADFFTKNDFHENDKKIEQLYAMYIKNLKKASDSEGLPSKNEQTEAFDVKQKKTEQAFDVKQEKTEQAFDVKREKTEQTFDVKQEPLDLDEPGDSCEGIDWELEELAQEIRGNVYEKLDTFQASRVLADINKDRQNIDQDHCYTNKNMYKDMRFIMPRVNFHRVNDLLYPAPDIAKKKDKVLAGKISERMASILSGHPREKTEEVLNYGVEELLKVVVKREQENKEFSGFIKPEYVELNAAEFSLIDMIKHEPNDEEFSQEN